MAGWGRTVDAKLDHSFVECDRLDRFGGRFGSR
jgi:hypothetical protein